MVKRPVFVDSALGQTNSTGPGQVKLKLANPLQQVTKVRLRDAQVPRLDDITYVAIGLRCGRASFVDNVQLPYNPSQVSTSGLFNVTGLTPGPPLFAVLPTAQASSVAAIEAGADVPYVYINQERYEFEFHPAINTLDELEIQLYRPPNPATPNVLAPYDTVVYLATLDAPPSVDLKDSLLSNKGLTDQSASSRFFTARVIATNAATLLLGSVSSTSAASVYTQYLTQAGLLAVERSIYTIEGTLVGTVQSLKMSTTQTTLNLEFECGR